MSEQNKILLELLSCVEAWEPDARLIGNLRAADIRASLQVAISALAEVERLSLALKPFAAMAPHLYNNHSIILLHSRAGAVYSVGSGCLPDAEITVEDFTRARDALEDER